MLFLGNEEDKFRESFLALRENNTLFRLKMCAVLVWE